MNAATLNEFATRYTAAWCSQKAADVAAFFAEDGWLKINRDPVCQLPDIDDSLTIKLWMSETTT